MSDVKITIDELGSTIQKIVDEYSQEAQEVVNDTLPKVGKKAVSELKKTSPKRTGNYAKGWKSKVEKGRLGDRVVVYNKDRYQLTHLLEKGHVNRGGGRTQAIPHIKPAEENAVNQTIKLIKEGLR